MKVFEQFCKDILSEDFKMNMLDYEYKKKVKNFSDLIKNVELTRMLS